MSAYEQITNRIEHLRTAEMRCASSGAFDMARVWYLKAAELEAKRADMTIADASLTV